MSGSGKAMVYKKNKSELKLSLMAVAVSQCLVVTIPQAATLRVETAIDSIILPVCSLRGAIGAINAGRNQNNCINFSGNGFGVNDTIEFTSFFNSPRTINLGNSGELLITKSVTINGPGEERLTIDGNSNGRVFNADGVEDGDAETDNININNLTITNARTSGFGGGIYASRLNSLNLSNLTVSNNSAYGGAGVSITYAEEMVIDNLTVVDNTATQFGAGLYMFASDIANNQIIRDSQFSGNTANGSIDDDAGTGGGGGIHLRYSNGVTLERNQFIDNSTISNGGGILITNSNDISIRESTISGNTASYAIRDRVGGGVAILSSTNTDIQNSTISNNGSNSLGGGIAAIGSNFLNLSQTKVDNNTTVFSGGGVYARGSDAVIIENSSISGNSSTLNGGGVTIRGGGGQHFIRFSTLSRNRSNQLGGGLHTYGSGLEIGVINSTFSGNSTTFNGGGMYVGQGARAYLASNTITGNFATDGAGIFRDDQSTEIATGANNVIANSRGGPDCGHADRTPIFVFQFDWVKDGSCSRPADGDPRLGPLQDNGGFGRTHAPEPGSVLIGAGSSCEATDQRGEIRPFIGCNIGSVEAVIRSGSIFVVPLPDGSVVTFEL